MKLEQIEVQTKAGVQVLDENGNVVAKKATFNYSMPESLDEAKAMITEQAVFAEFISGYRVTIQGPARKVLESCESNDSETNNAAVQSFMDSWKYGDKSPRGKAAKVDYAGAILAEWDSYSPEKQQSLIAALAAKAGVPQASAPEADEEEVSSNRRPSRVGR